ncbi:MAG: hypothetical protein KDH94_03465, partial [Coxiellaceae bacterium]|nr:hypothetical protein [Coxiellaceae bacterium]
ATLIIEALAGGLILNQATIENLLEIPNLLATAIEQNQLNRLPDSIVYDYLGIHKVEKANRQSAEKLYHYLLNHNNDPRYDTMLKRCLTYSAKACIFHYKNVANRTPKFIELFVEYHPNEFVDTIDNPKLIEPLIKHDSPAISGQVAHFLAAKPEWHEVLDDETLYILMSVVKIDFENNEKIKDRIDQYCFRKVFSDLVTCIQDKSINPRLLLINLFSHTSKISSEMLQDYAQLAFSKNTLPELSPGNLITLDALNAALNYYNTDSVSSDAGDAFKHFKHFKQTIHYLHKKYKDIYGNETGLLHPKDDWEDWINVRYMRIHIYHVFPVSRKLDEPAASGNIATTTGFGFKSPEKQSSPARLGLFDKKNDPKKTKGNNTASEGTATATGFGFQNKDDNNDPAPPNFSAKAQ